MNNPPRCEERNMKQNSPCYVKEPVYSMDTGIDPVQEQRKVEWTLCQTAVISAASLILMILCRFRQEQEIVNPKTKNLAIASEALEAAETGVMIISAATFFFSFVQLVFIFKFLKTHSEDQSKALTYIKKTSFFRILVQSLWFLALFVYITGIIIQYSLEPSKSMASRGIAFCVGTFALLFCVFSLFRTLCLWSTALFSRPDQTNYSHLATLV